MGTPGYCAPEMLTNKGYSYKLDLFSLGVLFYCLVSGIHLFNGKTIVQILRNNSNCDISHIKATIKGKLSKAG